MKTVFKLQLIAFLAIFASFSVLVAQAQEETAPVSEPIVEEPYDPGHPICDHNGDGVRNLSDVALFAQCADTFDANGDGVHDLSDITLYSQNKMDDKWCADVNNFVCDAAENLPAESPIVEEPYDPGHPICDHNGDGVRNLSDVVLFAQCADTFDANGDGVHDLSDMALYSQNKMDDKWCADVNNFVCDAADNLPAEPASSNGSSGATAPEIINVNSEVSCGQVDITWNTTKDALTWIVYGQNTDYDQTYKGSEYVSEHSVTLTDLDYDTTYNFMVKALSEDNISKSISNRLFTTPSATECGVVLGEKITQEEPKQEEPNKEFEPKVLGVKEEAKTPEVCTYNTPDEDVLGQTEWEDGTLLRGCGPEIYIIENQTKRHIVSLTELFQYIGQRIYNVTNDILDLF